MRSFKRLPSIPPPFFSVLYSSLVWDCGTHLTTLLESNESPCWANPKRLTVVKRKAGERMETGETLLLIICTFFERDGKRPRGKTKGNTLGKTTTTTPLPTPALIVFIYIRNRKGKGRICLTRVILV